MINSVFFISDLHLGHRNIILYSPQRQHFKTIEEHNETLINNINTKCNKNDTLWILGDVCFGRYNLELLKEIKPRMKFVLGNHDPYPEIAQYGRVFGAAEHRKYVLTHIPVHPDQLPYGPSGSGRYRGNIHGHLHDNTRVMLRDSYDELEIDPYYWNVNADSLNLFPIEWSELKIKYSID